MLTGFFQDSDFIVVLQTRFGSGFLPLRSGLESDSKKLDSKHFCYLGTGPNGWPQADATNAATLVWALPSGGPAPW